MMTSSLQADRIQESIGVMLCISTMAAAGMGNMVSDLAGMDWGNENGGIAEWDPAIHYH